MAKKRAPKRRRRVAPDRRIDVTRLEYEHIFDLAQRNAEAIARLEHTHDIQLRRTAELQAELNELRKQVSFRR
jgi:hypothetical protein